MDDTHESLATISSRNYPKSIISMMLDIQTHRTAREKSFDCIKKLDCLYFKPKRGRVRGKHFQSTKGPGQRRQRRLGRKGRLGRHRINGFSNPNYVAVSYTLKPSPDLDPAVGGYFVEPRPGHCGHVSQVNDCIFDRVAKYLRSVSLNFFWIDQESINQQNHAEKAAALEVIDLVYAHSESPIALLSTPITTGEELSLLVRVLRGQISRLTTRKEAWNAIQVLKTITSDPWWTRAWTFQEDYSAGIRMTLLIPHDRSLEPWKLQCPELGNLTGELCINLANFREEATRLCCVYQAVAGFEAAQVILEKAAKYNILLREKGKEGNEWIRTSMSPFIIADIGGRKLERCWDRLPITGNCCRYSVRLNTDALRKSHSLSISLLAYFLLNGEILNNKRYEDKTTLDEDIYSFLKKETFSRFAPPVRQQLTFIKGCRFIDAHLTMDGTETSGHLWELGRILSAEEFACNLPWEPDDPEGLPRHVRRRLRQLATVVTGHGHKSLAKSLDKFLENDGRRRNEGFFSKWYQDLMAEEVVTAIDECKSLRLGCLALPCGRSTSYSSIFISNDEEDGWVVGKKAYVFTASCPEGDGSDSRVSEDLDKHVSLEVECRNIRKRSLSGQLPQLYTKRWVNGLCFFNGCSREKVLFPYPKSLAEE